LGSETYADPPLWSPDSKSLLRRVVHPDLKRQQLLVLDRATGKARVVFEQADAAWVNAISFGWSPDSRSLFYTSDQDGWEHLYTVAAEGGPSRQLTHGAWEIHKDALLGRDPHGGNYLYYSSTSRHERAAVLSHSLDGAGFSGSQREGPQLRRSF
jgi:hypothetical protein